MKKLLPYLLLGLFTLWIVSALRAPKAKGYMDDVSFGQLPVLREGRLQPLEAEAFLHAKLAADRRRHHPCNLLPLARVVPKLSKG